MKRNSIRVSPNRRDSELFDNDKDISYALDEADPNFDPECDTTVKLGNFSPCHNVRSQRNSGAPKPLEIVKSTIVNATLAYISNLNKDEFDQVVDQLVDLQTATEIPKCILSMGLDLSADKRVAVSDLLRHLVHTSRLSKSQVEFAFQSLFNRLHDLTLDVPHASELLREFLRRAVTNGYCDNAAAQQMCQGADIVSRPEEVARLKVVTAKIVDDYFCSDQDVEEAELALKKCHIPPEFFHQFVKSVIYVSMDRGGPQRESASVLLAFLATPENQIEIQKGFQQLLEGMEDVVDDIPEVVTFMECFLVRAIFDEVLPPSFATRSLMGLKMHDLGKQAIEQAQDVLSMPSSGIFASNIWNPFLSSELKEVMSSIANYYLLDGNKELAIRVLRHASLGPTLIKRMFVVASSSPEGVAKVHDLLVGMNPDIVKKGIALIRSRLPDLALDVPDIAKKFDQFTLNLK